MLLVISAPSGAGKTTLARALMAEHSDIRLSVSHTTRRPRPDERDGADYHFIDDAAFDEMIRRDAFLEWAPVHDHRYGTSRAEVDSLRAAGFHVLFDVDYQGGIAIMAAHADAVSVFILPPSLAELERRIRGRRTESPESLARRLANARGEIRQYRHYGYVLVNDDLEQARAALDAIFRAERQRTGRMEPRIAGLISSAGG